MGALPDVLHASFACLSSPCDECALVEPRTAFPACPHGDLERPLDFVMVGLNPELPGYRTTCSACGGNATFRDFVDAGNRCLSCQSEDVHFWVPRTYAEWRADGAAGDVRGFANQRLDIGRLEAAVGRRVNFANARYSPWPSTDEKTIRFGAKVGGHLLDFLAATRPHAILIYSTAPWDLLRTKLVPGAAVERETFFTSGGRRHMAASFPRTWARHNGEEWLVAGVAISQARDADHAVAGSLRRREWAADRLAAAILETGAA